MTENPDISPGYMACDDIATASFQKEHLNSFSTSNKKLYLPRTNSLPTDQNNDLTTQTRRNSLVSRGRSPPPHPQQQQQQFRRMESGHELTITAKQTKTRQRKNVGAFRRAKQQSSIYDTWKGRVGVHVEYEEIELKKLIAVIYTTLSTEWELIDCYDVVRLWLPVNSDVNTSSSIPTATSTTSLVGGEGGYDTNNQNSNEIHASMPEVFVFGFGAVVFWNFTDETSEKSWINRHISPHIDALGLKHNIESIGTACDEMGFCYGDSFRWRRDVVQLYTKDAGEKMAVSFAFAKSANLSIYEWRLEQAVSKGVLKYYTTIFLPAAIIIVCSFLWYYIYRCVGMHTFQRNWRSMVNYI